ncbi:MAG: hypothetical protein QXJ75_06330 [Candidatus Bathyarchaeia archaeon]
MVIHKFLDIDRKTVVDKREAFYHCVKIYRNDGVLVYDIFGLMDGIPLEDILKDNPLLEED